jgi:hypothetical protein
MAGLDTSIALGIKPVDFGDPNEGRMNALRAQMMQMQMQQGQFNMMKAQRDMQYQDQQRGAAAAEKARSDAAEKKFNALVPGYITPEGTTTYNARDVEDTTSPTAGLVNAEGIPDNVKSFTEKTPSKIDYQGIAAKAFALEGKYGKEFAGKMFELGKKNEEFLKANEENTKKKLDDAYAQVGPLVMQAQTPQDIADWTRRLYSDPVLGPEARKLKTVDKAIQDNMQQFLQNPDQFKAVMGRMITGEKLYEITRRTPDIDKTTGFDTNYRSPTFGARMFEPPQTAGGKSNLDLDAAYRQQKQDEARAAALETQGDTTGAAAIREQAQARVDALKDQIEKATTIGGKGGSSTKLQQLQSYRDRLRADLEANPDDKNIQQALAEVTANINKEAKFSGAAQEEGRKGFEAALNDITEEYKKLGAQGMLLTPQSSIGNRAAAVLADALPAATAIVSPERAAPVAALKNLRENMKAAIIQASGGVLTSKNFDSNAEAKALLDSMSSPGQPLDTILATLNSMSRKYGNGRVLTAEDLTGGKEQNTSSGKSKPPIATFNRPR